MAGLTGNTKDTGDKNVRVDFAHGPFPLQPNDDRGGNILDLTVDNHSNAQFQWAGYPAMVDNDNGTKYIVPTFVVDTTTLASCVSGLNAVGITDIVYATVSDGANAGKFKSISPVAGTELSASAQQVTLTTAVA